MVADNRSQTRFRVCPDRGEDAPPPLVRQQITVATCRERQLRAYHKCAACVHREDALWVPKVERIPVMD